MSYWAIDQIGILPESIATGWTEPGFKYPDEPSSFVSRHRAVSRNHVAENKA